MSGLSYSELCSYSNYSFLFGASHPAELVEQAHKLGYQSLAITDRLTLSGVVKAHSKAKELGFNYIVATKIELIENFESADKFYDYNSSTELTSFTEEAALPISVLLYATSLKSYQSISTLLSIGKRRAPKGSCWLLIEDLETITKDTECILHIERVYDSRVTSTLKRLKNLLKPKTTSIGLHYSYGAHDKERRKLVYSTKLPVVALGLATYHVQSRRTLHDTINCIRNRTSIFKAGLSLEANSERYLKSISDRHYLFRDDKGAIERSNEIAEKAKGFSLEQIKYEYPKEICPAEESPAIYLRKEAFKGARRRYPKGIPLEVEHLINKELELIRELDYEKYFLTVYKIVRFARSKQILCQGRGAAANSAVCFALGITAVDPSKVKLLFERFVSKERNEPPDIDIDFEHERREEVIQYIYKTFGRKRAALVCEVVTYRTRSAVRDICKVFELSDDTAEALIRAYRNSQERSPTKDDLTAVGVNPEEPLIRKTLQLVAELKSFPRHLSQHVGGFIISDTPISNIVPIENAAMQNRTVIEWDKYDIEEMGMLKIDVLALGMLTCVRKALQIINEDKFINTSQLSNQLELHNVPPEDLETYKLIQKADTLGVFQIESRAQMAMLPRLKPKCFYDLVIEVAIVRPGPIQGDMVHPYLRRRQGKEKVSYPSDAIKSILEPTLGIPLFQEQVMELSIHAAGFTPGEADSLRRAMASWKRHENMLIQFSERIINGMKARGYSEEFAQRVLEQIKGFGVYGFPQSHAASFALLVYISAWIKCHYPAVFACALINSQPMGFYKPSQIIQDAETKNVKIKPIDIKHSEWDCTVEDHLSSLRLGFRMVKGINKKEILKLLHYRDKNKLTNSLKLLWRKSEVKLKTLKLIAEADGFLSLGIDRKQALWELSALKDVSMPLFDHLEDKKEVFVSETCDVSEVLKDYEMIGHSLKYHPLQILRPSLSSTSICQMKALRNNSYTTITGIVIMRQKPMTASGVVFLTLEDETGTANIIVWPKLYKQFKNEVWDSAILEVKGVVQKQEGVIHLIMRSAEDKTGELKSYKKLSRNFR